MEITVYQAQGKVPVTVLQPRGDLDAASYRDLIAKGQAAYKAGARDVLLDLSAVPYMSSSGLVALHSLALLLRGEKLPNLEAGWGALRAVKEDSSQGLQPHLKLLNPQPKVDKALEMAGFKQFFAIYNDLALAIAAF